MTTPSEMFRDLRQRIANNVRFYRYERGMTQKEMADHAGLHANTLYLLESPERDYNVPLAILTTLAHSLHLPGAALMVAREEQPTWRGKPAARFLKAKKARYFDGTR